MEAKSTAAEACNLSERVQMSRRELDLYVRDGRPTGLLLRSVAMLKGMSTSDVSRASGVSVGLVGSIFADQGVANMSLTAVQRVADVLGIDLATMRFASGQVHILHLQNAPGRFGSATAVRAIRAAGLLARESVFAGLKLGRGLTAFRWRGRLHVAGNRHFRCLFVSPRPNLFSESFIPSSRWARGERAASVVPITNKELIENLLNRDLTSGEFDDLFKGDLAITWDSVRASARASGVTKEDLIEFIDSRARQLEAEVEAQARSNVINGRPHLQLVESEDSQPMVAYG